MEAAQNERGKSQRREESLKIVRWGILGTGRIAHTFCDTLKALPQAEIYAVGSRTAQKAAEFVAEFGIQKYYSSYEEFAADDNIDIVYVATPIACHYDNVKLLLEAGRNVLCEKTFTQRVEEAEELYALARKKNLFLMEAMWTKCQPVFQKIMDWKKEGAFGEIQAVEAKFYTCATTEHRLLKDRIQGGSLYDLTIYPLTYACALLGYEPSKVHAVAVKGGDNVDTMESIQLEYENGAFASISGGLSCRRQFCLYIHGTKARILMDEEAFFTAQKVVLLDWDNHPIEVYEAPFEINGYEYEAREAMNCILQKKINSAQVPMEETIQVIRLMEQCSQQWSR